MLKEQENINGVTEENSSSLPTHKTSSEVLFSFIKEHGYVATMLRSYSYLLFSNNVALGAIVLLLSFVNPSAGVHGVMAFWSALLFGELTGREKRHMVIGLQLYNPLLVGLSIGYLYDISALSLLFTAIAGVFTFIVSTSFNTVFYSLFRLPILNFPFAVTATVIYLAAVRYSSLYIINTNSFQWLNIEFLPLWLSGLFKALGILLFLPYDIVGLILLLIFLFFSRINFFLIVMGYYTGTIFHGLLTGSFNSAFQDFYNFNFVLIALALGGYFLIPSKRSYLIAIVGVVISSVILEAASVFWSDFHIPVFTIPFAVTVLLLLHALKISGFPYITGVFLKNPEENLEHWCSYTERFGTSLPAPRLPFSGEWSVYQAFDDNWTHQGLWKYAVDFVIEDIHSGMTYRNDGNRLEDYFCYNKPVLSPVNGVVAALQNDLSDNPIGEVDKDNNWGNHIVIYSDYGYYVELSHLVKGSIMVQLGERVSVGQKIARCGNSGYSPQPHIHMQVQSFNYVGSPAILFTLSHAVSNGNFIKETLSPQKGDRLSPLTISRRLNTRLLFILDDYFTYEVKKDGTVVEELSLMVKMAIDGSYFLEDQKRGSALFYSHTEGLFTFTSFAGNEDSPLRFFYIALPSLPITENKLSWNDSVRGSLIYRRQPLNSFFKSFRHTLYSAKGSYSTEGNGIIKGEVVLQKIAKEERVTSQIEITGHKGFQSLSVTVGGNCYELTLKK